MVIVLTAITVIATGLLAYVNQLTAGPIAEANAKALSDAIAAVSYTHLIAVCNVKKLTGK